ncbi:long-chain fatty acid--CoA ligase [Mycobacterium sp. CVI_P3]|uniref:Long-chain fatty acid--CoA ligase n=1 Tax=Mycobacterium pinniadriaticum TaxID=2994102 RepID=A0ABT3SCU0_9MYCO|nr:long-chain fatty acid--CoA ligase [Mycobacterium pinniadriaticum]MCX2930856.1 long-chain fatty acid--CoA ligase [Mycobacterium pinniadriaticum]MCX2937280.1 long-chain fatty acid--CoA ligase [Mycobacterium pinniadriaticum]
MHGLMQQRSLSLPHVFHRAERYFGHKKVVTATGTGAVVVSTLASVCDQVRRLATAFDELGIGAEARVGTFCWNTESHLALYLAAPCTGRVLHTVNIRLFPEQIVYIVNHAQDEILFVDRSLVSALWPLAEEMPTVKYFVVIDDGSDGEIPEDPRVLGYARLLADNAPRRGDFVIEDENTASAMCYTSGTTGNPKGVMYSHRSTVLHSLTVLAADVLGLGERDVVMPIVPMFHANSWGLPYAALLAGADLVLPGPNMSPQVLLGLLSDHRVTVTGAVPTIWMGAAPLLAGYDLTELRFILSGGSAVPKALSQLYQREIGVPITQVWGMTETSPVAAVCRPRTHHAGLSEEQLAEAMSRQGFPAPLVELRVVDSQTGMEVPRDDRSTGEVQAAGPWIASSYYHSEDHHASFTDDGWLRTGDVAVCDPYGSLLLVDRTKDLVKSGGEWISSVQLENEIMSHPKVAEAAVIAIPHERWVERPLACVVVKSGESLTAEEVIDHLVPRVAKWWLPDAVEFIDAVPKTSVGKFSKKTLRAQFEDYRFNTADTAEQV